MVKKLLCKIRGHKYGRREELATNGDILYFKQICRRCGNLNHIKEDIGISKRKLANVLTGVGRPPLEHLRERADEG